MAGKIRALVCRPLHQEVFYVFLGQFASAVGTLVGVKMLTSFVQPETYGLVALGMSVANLFLYTLGSPVAASATRFFHMATNGGRLQEYERSLVRVGWMATAVLLFAATVCALADNLFYALVVLLSLLLCIDRTFNGIQTGARNRRTVAFMQPLLNWSRFLFAMALLLLASSERVELIFAGFCMSATMVVGLQLFFYHRKIRNIEPGSSSCGGFFSCKQFNTYLWPLAIVGLISWGEIFIDRWSLGTFAGLNAVGMYFALYQISYAPVLLLNSCVYYFVSPILFEKAGDTMDATRMRKIYFYNEIFSALTLLLAFFLAGAMGVLHGWAGRLLLGGAFVEYSFLLPWLVLAGGIYATGSQLLLSIQSGLNLKPLLLQKTVSVVVAVACYALGTLALGLPGAVFGGLSFAIFYVAFAFWFHWRLKRAK